MYYLLFVVTGFLIFEGVNTLPASATNKTFEGSLSQKHAKKSSRRSMGNEKQSGYEADQSLESVVLAVNTGVEMISRSSNSTDFVDKIAKVLIKLAKDSANNPVYRSKGEEFDIKPEIINFKDEKPSVMVEINSQSVIHVLKTLLRSQMIQDLVEKLSKDAAVVYRSMKQELDKEDARKNNHQ